jgi:hypothetical protein
MDGHDGEQLRPLAPADQDLLVVQRLQVLVDRGDGLPAPRPRLLSGSAHELVPDDPAPLVLTCPEAVDPLPVLPGVLPGTLPVEVPLPEPVLPEPVLPGSPPVDPLEPGEPVPSPAGGLPVEPSTPVPDDPPLESDGRPGVAPGGGLPGATEPGSPPDEGVPGGRFGGVPVPVPDELGTVPGAVLEPFEEWLAAFAAAEFDP